MDVLGINLLGDALQGRGRSADGFPPLWGCPNGLDVELTLAL